ncbi:MAG: hypothetical protein RLZZ361_1477 [Cyanobacteriota bacterium]|jgi:arginyl-tRNA synthetase
MLKDNIENLVKEALQKILESGQLGKLHSIPENIGVELTKNPEHGDRALNIAMKINKEANLAPRIIAESLKNELLKYTEFFQKVEIAGPGFVNLTLDWNLLNQVISNIITKKSRYGFLEANQRPNKEFKSILLEYVSANPTGDLHLGHGRQAVLGSAIANLLKCVGYQVNTEFYINDAGVQIEKLANSTREALLIESGKLSPVEYDHENNYPLDSIQEFINLEVISKHYTDDSFNLQNVSDEFLGSIAKNIFLEVQKDILEKIHVRFDSWYSEKEQLHNKNLVTEVCKLLDKQGATYNHEGALWFKAKEFGDERDRVLQKADGNFTYLTADLAYHLNKFARGNELVINLWGADHHGQIPGIKGGLKALGQNPDRLEIILVQLVSLCKNGQEFKMSKRKGNIVLVRDLVEEVGVDAFRYFLVESQANNRIIFDLELACKQDKENPVYYIQYAHARCSSILRNICDNRLDQETGVELSPLLSKNDLDNWIEEFKINNNLFKDAFEDCNPDEINSTKALILALANFPEEIKESALSFAPYKIANYLKNLASLFHQFYGHNRVICDNQKLMKARLAIVLACKITLANALQILSISTPEKM